MMVLDIRKNHDLSKLSTLRIQASAEYFAAPKNIRELKQAIAEAKNSSWDWNILGAGSNILLSSRGIPGLLLSTNDLDYLEKLNFNKQNYSFFEVGSGMRMPRYCAMMSREALAGTEFMEGIPGSLGGGIVMNAGAHGSEITNILAFIKVFNLKTEELELWINQKFFDSGLLSADELENLVQELSTIQEAPCKAKIIKNLDLKYRSSNINPHEHFVFSGIFYLKADDKEEIRKRVVHNNTARTNNQPIKSWTCGCTFKNPSADYGAGKLIQDLGLKGYVFGDFRISDLHANFFENKAAGTSIDFCKLIAQVKEKALKEKGIVLHPEVQRMGIFTPEEKALWD